MGDKVKPFFENLGKQIKRNILTKWIGFAIGLIVVILTLVQTVLYGGLAEKYFSATVMAFTVLAMVVFLILSVFKQTSPLAPMALFIFECLTLLAFIDSVFQSTTFVDEVSTLFFDGFSMGVLLSQSYGICALFFVINTLLSVVAIYVPQNSDWLYNKIVSKKNADTEG